MPRVAVATVLLCMAGMLLACRPAGQPSTLQACLDRPLHGYATPALKRRLKQCRHLIRPGAPPPVWGLAVSGATP